jgi:hypothetical protein
MTGSGLFFRFTGSEVEGAGTPSLPVSWLVW